MYIRITFGRDRGYVKDFPIPEAKEMLALGQALPVDFDEPDALGFRHLAAPDTELHLVQPPAASSQPPETQRPSADTADPTVNRPFQPPQSGDAATIAAQAHPHRERKKKP